MTNPKPIASPSANKRKLTINKLGNRVRESVATVVAWIGTRMLQPAPRSPSVSLARDLDRWRNQGRN